MLLPRFLNKNHLLYFRKLQSSEEISQVLEIKLLLTMPERIWTAVDEKKFAFAAELFLLAAHTHLGLQVTKAADKYPLVGSQWNTVAGCRQAILDRVRINLSIITLSAVVSCYYYYYFFVTAHAQPKSTNCTSY